MGAQGRLRIGSRASPLALAQAEEVKRRLVAAHPDLPPEAVEIVPMRTAGDRAANRPLAEIGGKGLFTVEIEAALAAGRLDLAVHSMKDMPAHLPEGLAIAGVPPRADPRDGLLAAGARRLDDLPRGTVVGTSSLRRRAQLLRRRPDLRIVELRGNVGTRMQKLRDGVAQATLLAMAGLTRLGESAAAAPLAPEELLPALAQGALCLEARRDDARAMALAAAIEDADSAACVAAERAFLAALDGSCRTPIAGLARLDAAGRLSFVGEILRPDGGEVFAARREGTAAEAAALGADAAAELRRRAGDAFFAALG